jgi:S-layer homology domain
VPRSRSFRAASLALSLALFYASTLTAQSAAQAVDGPPTRRLVPKSFGIVDDTVTTIPAIAFYPETNQGASAAYFTTSARGRYGANGVATQFFAPLDLPGGAFIDFIGLNSDTDVGAAYTASLELRENDGSVLDLGSVTSTVHGWATDRGPHVRLHLVGPIRGELLIHVTEASNPGPEYFGWVEIWWRRSVSPAPGTATFADVQPGDFGFQFIEALAASGITGGCGGGNYCPNNNVTRAQMAVFLAKALGLHWPGGFGTP